jgi:cyclophilin family peptidyl-prolyl cis-trans isomerase
MKRISYLLLCCLVAAVGTAAYAQTSTNQTNTVVRFRIGYGTTFYGNVDIELFNDKPITVTNFLKYLQQGAYANGIIHDCRPGFALVGGLGAVANPYSDAPFQALYRIPEDASITNEFTSGTLRSNVFGTLAMKKETSSANSATTQWLLNLGDNIDGTGVTNLDTYLGGFTVFGQVIAGANVLQAFNQFTLSGGIADMFEPTFLARCSGFYLYPVGNYLAFDALPVGFSKPAYIDCIQYNDLFTVQMTMLSGPDVVPPKPQITFPKNKASVTLSDATLTVNGTATDNIGVSTVRVYLNTNGAISATMTNGTWTAILSNVPPGTNLLVAEAADAAGNRSEAQIRFFHSVRVPLLLNTVGAGTVSGARDGQLLELTRNYTVTAKPNPGNLFGAWSGSVLSANPRIGFMMESNTTLTASFVTNLFFGARGTYNGLIYDPSLAEQQSSGYLTLTVGTFGSYSARLLMNGKSHRFSGSFSPGGGETNLIERRGTNELLVRMILDLTNGTDQITGNVTNNQITAIDPAHGWLANLQADRVFYDGRARMAPQAGKYTLLLPHDTNSPAGPDGDGFGTVSVSTRGAISFSGSLADGTRAVQKTTISKSGAWPLYVPLYRDRGALVSWVSFTNETATDFTGLANWFKQSQVTAKYYRDGFTNETTILGSHYLPPAATNRVLEFPNGVVGFVDGNLATNFTNNVRLDLNRKVVNLSSNKLTMTVAKPSGLFSGTVAPPGVTRSLPYKGAILQKQKLGGGFLLGTNRSARVSFGPE